MYDQIRFPTDGSEPAESVLKYALQIAAEHEATIHVLNVVDTESLLRVLRPHKSVSPSIYQFQS